MAGMIDRARRLGYNINITMPKARKEILYEDHEAIHHRRYSGYGARHCAIFLCDRDALPRMPRIERRVGRGRVRRSRDRCRRAGRAHQRISGKPKRIMQGFGRGCF